MGNEPTAAGGGRKEAREWQRSKFHEQTANKKFWAPQQEILRRLMAPQNDGVLCRAGACSRRSEDFLEIVDFYCKVYKNGIYMVDKIV